MTSVAIVGQAWRTPLGRSIHEAVSRLLAGERAAIASPRAAGYACSVVAPIVDEPAKSRQSRFLRRMGLFGLEVAHEAFAIAKAAAAPLPALADGNRIGLFAGVGGLRAHWDDMLKALEHQAEDGANGWERGLREVHPYWMLRHLSNNVHALAAMDLRLRGEGATYGGATGGAQALAAAARALNDGAIDAALVVAYDSLLEPETLVELGARRAAALGTDPSLIATAYDDRAAGFVPGEAAGGVVLVRAVDAPPDAVRIAVADGADGEREEPTAATLARTLRSVLASRGSSAPTISGDAGIARASLAGIAFVDGAARAWPDRDAAEIAMLAELLSAPMPLTAITAAFGQLGAATTVIQAIALGELLRRDHTAPVARHVGPSAGPSSPGAEPSSPGAEPSRPSTGPSSPSAGPSSPNAGPSRSAVGLSTGAPGLCAAIRVDVTPGATR